MGVSVELFNVGGWLTHGDFALESSADFLAVVEHRLIPARERGEWSRLRRSGVSSIWAPACQETSHVGNAGVGVVSLKGASLTLPTSAAAQFKGFFDCGRVVRCTLPLGAGRFMHLFVLYGSQGAERLALTNQLFDAAFAELAVVARGSLCLLPGDFNVEPTKIPCLSKGISAGLWVDLDAAWSSAQGRRPAVTCKRSWDSASGSRGDFLVGCPLATAALFSCSVSSCRWLQPHFAVSAMFDCDRWSCQDTQPVRCTPLWPASWLPAIDKSRGSKSVEVQRVWEVYDDRLRFMSRADSDSLTGALLNDDVSSAWAIWSSAAETALADAYCFSGGPVSDRGLVLGRGTARFRVVRLGGPKVRKLRSSAVDPADGVGFHLYRDSSTTPLLDLRRRLKVVFDILGGILREGFTLTRSFELAYQWSCILSAGPLHPVTMDDLLSVQGGGLDWFREVVGDLHDRLSDFIHRIVVHRRDEAIRSWRGWLREDPLVRPYRWLRPDLVPPSLFLRCDLEYFLIRSKLMRNSVKLGFPTFVALGKGKPAWRNSMRKLRGGYLCCLRLICHP